MCKKTFASQVPLVFMLFAAIVASVRAATTPGSLTFSNTPLLHANGNSEPAISIGSDGAMAITALPWIRTSRADRVTRLWTGPFGSTPTFQGPLDGEFIQPGLIVTGGQDADVDIGSTGRLHATTLLLFVNDPRNHFALGVSAISCAGPGSADCTTQIIDTTQADRSWITSDGPRVWISYHDSAGSSMIRVQRSDDDGLTWKKVASPIPGQAEATGNSTYNSLHGPIVADPFTHNVYNVHAAGETGIIKGRGDNIGNPGIPGALYNNIYVSRSTDGGESWTANLVSAFAPGTHLANSFPALAVDSTNGSLYAAWSDAETVWFSASSDQGSNWSPAVAVNAAPATTALFPWLAAYDGTVNLVYYGTDASSKDDPSAVWNTYLAQTTDDGANFAQSLVSSTPNHVGVICTEGSACDPSTRTLLDLFEVAINPQNGLAAIVYTDDVLTKDDHGNPLPQIVMAQQSLSLGATLTAGSQSVFAATVPEPSISVLIAAALAIFPLRRWRRSGKPITTL